MARADRQPVGTDGVMRAVSCRMSITPAVAQVCSETASQRDCGGTAAADCGAMGNWVSGDRVAVRS